MITSTPNYWDGVETLQPGLIVKYKGRKDSDFYRCPEPGTLLTLIAEDTQMEYNKVWICRWYDEDKRINLCPLMPVTFERAEEPIDLRTLRVVDNYYAETGIVLNNRALDKALDFLFENREDVINPEAEHFPTLEVTLLNDGGFGPLMSVVFPVTLRLYKGEYLQDNGLFIKGSILNMLTGVEEVDQLSDSEFYYFLRNEVTY